MKHSKSGTRRDVLAATLALAAGGLLACTRQDDQAAPVIDSAGTVTDDELLELSAREAVRAIRDGDVKAEVYATALLARAIAHADLNAFTTLEPDSVLAAANAADRRRFSGAALGPLHGLPIPVKDSINTREYPTTGGTPALRTWRPAEDAELVRRLRAAGGIVMGKTTIHELSFGWTSNNLAYGAVRNPYDRTRIPGGSSGGTAVAVAARMAPLGIAEDTQGSIRVPAALCGICGFRPTTGRYPNDGVIPITPLFDQVGPHARSVDDLRFFDEVLTGEATADAVPSLSNVRLGIARDYFFEGIDAAVADATSRALEKLEAVGVTLVEAEIPTLGPLIDRTTAQIQGGDVVQRLSEYLDFYRVGIGFDDLLIAASENIQRDFAEYALPGGDNAPSQADFVAARDRYLPELRDTMQRYFVENRLDAMIFPATMAAASPIGAEASVTVNGEQIPLPVALARNISPGSTAGIPGVVLPAGLTDDGLPVALELDAMQGNDRALLALGAAVERVLGPLPPPPL